MGYLGELITETDPVDYFPVGSGNDNQGIVAFDLREAFDDPGKLQAFAEVENFSAEPADILLRCYIGEDLMQAREATLAPGERQGFAFAGLPPGQSEPLRLELQPGDLLAAR